MSFQDPPRRQRPPRYPALAQYEDDPSSYQGAHARNGGGQAYQGFASAADTPRQRPPWDDPQQRRAWDSGAQQVAAGQPDLRDSGSQHAAWGSGAHRPARDTGGQAPARNSGAFRAPRDTPAQQTSWDLAGEQPSGELPRRTSGAFGALLQNDQDRPRSARHGAGRGRQPEQAIGAPRSRGLLAGALAGFLAAAVAIGVANLIAAFVRPQASPIIAVGEAFIDRTPNALKEFAIQKFGENDKNMLLLGMYVTIALIAVAIGVLAWRRLWIGVAGIGLFGLFGAFVAITRPDSHITDVIPSIVGGIAGIAAIVLLVQAGMPRSRAAWARGR